MIVTAQQGDTLDAICYRHLGQTAELTEQALQLNPGISALGPVIPMGTQITLPDQRTEQSRSNIIQLWD